MKHNFELTNLTASDFSSESVEIQLIDESVLRFNDAFWRQEGNVYAIYTEHWGYFAFYEDEATVIARRPRNIIK